MGQAPDLKPGGLLLLLAAVVKMDGGHTWRIGTYGGVSARDRGATEWHWLARACFGSGSERRRRGRVHISAGDWIPTLRVPITQTCLLTPNNTCLHTPTLLGSGTGLLGFNFQIFLLSLFPLAEIPYYLT
ncbi:hypothetical protein FN846DRAFT_11105 [Sphaerosporella brunnea]|uniref:Uncharacterized protein n=1 Tax=Sphaerosporella brunnea TaxID=1250544 RepID=A0A5J5EW64_9PEZI|nr:hypothetical protein FN846DRAFT_11105 [Sphaerosporella brunnea]